MGFEVVRRTPLSAGEAWARLTDWPRHSGLLPFTQIERLPGPSDGAGSGFTARTGIGRLHFDDPMEVTFWQPPTETGTGICRIAKNGQAVVGWAVVTVSPETTGSVVTWREEARFQVAGPLLDGPTGLLGRVVFARLVDHLLAG